MGYEIKARQGGTVVGDRIVFATEAAAWTVLVELAAAFDTSPSELCVVQTDDPPNGAGRWTIDGLAACIVEAWLESTVESWRPRAEVAYELASPDKTDVPTGDDRAWAEGQIGRELTDEEWSGLVGACRRYAMKVEASS